MVGGRKLGMTTGFGLILCIAICLCVARAEEDLYTKAKRALDAENHVHGKVRTLHAPAGEGIRPRTKTRRDEDDGFIERSDKSGAHSVKLRHSADGGSALARTRAKEEKWKTIAKDYKKQIEEDKHHAAYAADQVIALPSTPWCSELMATAVRFVAGKLTLLPSAGSAAGRAQRHVGQA
eukprot:861095-Rhodomonas_salina.2